MPELKIAAFATANTNLAACLGALKIPVVHEHPIQRIQDSVTGRTRVWWSFQLQDASGTFKAPFLGAAWDAREEFESKEPQHWMIPMRSGLEALEWVYAVFHGDRTVEAPIPMPHTEYSTTDFDLAAALKSVGCHVVDYHEGVYHFAQFDRSLLGAYHNCTVSEHPIALARRALHIRKLMVRAARDPRIKTWVEYTRGDPLNGGKVCRILAGSKRRDANALLQEFYS